MIYKLERRTLNMKFFRLAVILFFCLDLFILRAADHYVVPTNAGASSPFADWGSAATNIQDAVNVAANGETVWLTNGTYFAPSNCVVDRAMVFITNAITVRSFSGSYTNTVVNGNWPAYTNRVFLVSNASAVVSGLTITNGFFTNDSGAGVFIYNGLLTNCLIAGNVVTTKQTGAAGIHMASRYFVGTVSHCIIKGNKIFASAYGGQSAAAIYCVGNGTITNCLISENYNLYSAACLIGGIDSVNSCVMQGCIVSNNTAFYTVYLSSDNYPVNPRIIGSVICNNSGRGVCLGNCGSLVRNCLVVKNNHYGIEIATVWGGRVENCTVANNPYAGIFVDYSITQTQPYYVLNTIIFYNGTGGTNNISVNVNVPYTNCCTYPSPDLGVNNIVVTNPVLFVSTNNSNYRLTVNSPCVNAGTNQTWMTNFYDLDGGMRVRYGKVDMGAYEYINKGAVYNFH